ncbi:hypothetical protein PIB30_020221 [Stylosanthes scabra]|uniref:Uncharacterized protein n=1 Tax=Stylosanthes scabra TaxID=79078 RepID=A0ABU6S969_9FABA|nr:hypothetical protein [Stylosanthes scabra]
MRTPGSIAVQIKEKTIGRARISVEAVTVKRIEADGSNRREKEPSRSEGEPPDRAPRRKTKGAWVKEHVSEMGSEKFTLCKESKQKKWKNVRRDEECEIQNDGVRSNVCEINSAKEPITNMMGTASLKMSCLQIGMPSVLVIDELQVEEMVGKWEEEVGREAKVEARVNRMPKQHRREGMANKSQMQIKMGWGEMAV